MNVVVHRGPVRWGLIDESDRGGFAEPRSYCPDCGTTIPIRDLVPLVSFVLLKGRCAACGTAISWRYPAVEALGGVVVAAAFGRYGASTEAALIAIYGWSLLALAFIDLETGYLPDALTFPLIVGGVAVNAVDLFAAWPDAIIGAVVGYGAFWSIGQLFKMLRQREGLGLGDAKLLAAIGAWAGWQALPAVVFVGAVSSLIAVGVARARGAALSGEAHIAFGPGLAFAGFGVLIAPFALY